MRLIFPLGPFGMLGTIRIRPGTLNRARRWRAKLRRFCGLTLAPGRRTTAAATSSPSLLCGMENATASTTSPWPSSASSTSAGATCCPPRLMTSLILPTMNRYPSRSRYPRSPVRNQPSRNADFVAPGSLSYPSVMVGPRSAISPRSSAANCRPSRSMIAISAPADRPTEPGFRLPRGFAAI